MSIIQILKSWFSRKPKLVPVTDDLLKITLDGALLDRMKREGRTTCSVEELSDAISVEDAVKIQCAMFSAYCAAAADTITILDENAPPIVQLNVSFFHVSEFEEPKEPTGLELVRSAAKATAKQKWDLENDLREKSAGYRASMQARLAADNGAGYVNELTQQEIKAAEALGAGTPSPSINDSVKIHDDRMQETLDLIKKDKSGGQTDSNN